MSEPISKPSRTPESYSPQKPELAGMMKKAEALMSGKDVMYTEEKGIGVISIDQEIKVVGLGLEKAGWIQDAERIGNLWDDFTDGQRERIANIKTPVVNYGFYFMKPDTYDWDYIVGSEVSEFGEIDDRHIYTAIPAGDYIKCSLNEGFSINKWALDNNIEILQKTMPPYHSIGIYPEHGVTQEGQILYSLTPIKGILTEKEMSEKKKRYIRDVSRTVPLQYRVMGFGGYDWLVLEERDDKMLLLSEKIIGEHRYHHARAKVTWAECEMRQYLNNQFRNSFSEADKCRIVKSKVTNGKNPWYDTDGGDDTDDYIFLLSTYEMLKYFGDSGDMDKRNGWLWNGEKFEFIDGSGQILSDQYNGARIAQYACEAPPSEWWRLDWLLRTPGSSGIYVSAVSADGSIGFTGHAINYVIGVRPAMWLEMKG